MLRQILILVIACSATTSFVQATNEMYCGTGEPSNIIDEQINTCTQLIYGDKTYCCKNHDTGKMHCCDALDYAKTEMSNILTAVIGVVAVVMLLILCISCLCCTCCPCYKRRHRGTVYGKVQGPATVHVIATPAANVPQVVPTQPTSTSYPYPANQTAMPYAPNQPPPQYETAVYGKQAPYNPDYRQ